MKVSERFLKYVTYPSTSKIPDEECTEKTLAQALVEELKEIGLSDVRRDKHAYVYAVLPATPGYENVPSIGFLAHTDTADTYPGGTVKPRLHPNYDGSDIELIGRSLRVADFPHLKNLIGRTLITSDGTTLLGSDDRAGVAEIVTMLETVINENIPHGRVAICFSSDEESASQGLEDMNLEEFGCPFGFTVDGDTEGQLQYQNFNAATVVFNITGFSVHPGASKDTMINAGLVACEINSMLPSEETPRGTEGYEGYYHLSDIHGDVNGARICYCIREHSNTRFEDRINTCRHIAKRLNEKYGLGTVDIQVHYSYRNMEEKVLPLFHFVETAREGIEAAGIEPLIEPIRGGTDGAWLAFKGLPCPNLGTGGYAFHGPYEHTTVEGLERATSILINIVKRFGEKG